MASAGRILIMPKGAYNASTTYEMLDMVGHNGTSWLAKKTSVGIEPSDANNEYWQNMFGMDAGDIENLRKGLSNIGTELDKRIDNKCSLKLDDNGVPQLFVNDSYYGTFAFVDK